MDRYIWYFLIEKMTVARHGRLDYLDYQKASGLFCSRGWGWGQQYRTYYRILWPPDEWIVKSPSCHGTGESIIAKLFFSYIRKKKVHSHCCLLSHCKNFAKTIQIRSNVFLCISSRSSFFMESGHFFATTSPVCTPSRNHPRQPPGSFRSRWKSNSLSVPGASLKRWKDNTNSDGNLVWGPCSTPHLWDKVN